MRRFAWIFILALIVLGWTWLAMQRNHGENAVLPAQTGQVSTDSRQASSLAGSSQELDCVAKPVADRTIEHESKETAPAPAVVPTGTDEEQQWMKKWGQLSHGQLAEANERFAMQLNELATPVWDEYQARGEYEVLGAGTEISLPHLDEKPLMAIRMLHETDEDRRILKITIREEEYPELYALQRENLWMRARVTELKRIALR